MLGQDRASRFSKKETIEPNAVLNPRTDRLDQLHDREALHSRVLPASRRLVSDSRPLETPPPKSFHSVVIRWVPRWLRELAGYGFASLVALAADTLLLRSLVASAGWHYVPASIVSFTTGAAVAYLLSTRFVFESHRVTHRALEFGYFLALGVVGLAVNTAVLWIAVGMVGLGLVASKLFAAICTFTTNFVLRRWLLFSASDKERSR